MWRTNGSSPPSSFFNTSLNTNGSLGRVPSVLGNSGGGLSGLVSSIMGGGGALDHLSLKKQKINMGSEEVKQHKWFIGTNWSDVYYKKLTPPFLPDLMHEGDTQNFEKYDPADFTRAPSATDDQYEQFKDF